jgi:hypothetical protein
VAVKKATPGKATARTPHRSIPRPRIGVVTALRRVARDSANETVERGHCMSTAIGLRNTPEVKKRTGPLHTHSPTTAPATTHQGLPSLALRTASSGLPTKRAYMGSPDGRGALRRNVRPAMRPTERSGTVSEAGYRRISRIGYCVTSVTRRRTASGPVSFR